VPALRGLLEHAHGKVRREAVIALGCLGGAARSVLAEVEAGRVGTRAERELAARVLAGGG
jgi:RNase adaptor protein for sRNA GlmZ degradation